MRAVRLAVFLSLGLAGIAAHACTCASSEPATSGCPTFKKEEIIFVGTVLSRSEILTNDRFWQKQARYRVRVDEAITGKVAGEVDVYSGTGDADCSFHFDIGRQYLIEPNRNGDKLYAGICSMTQPIEETAVLLAQLRARRDGGDVPNLSGTLTEVRRRASQYQSDQESVGPVAGTVIRLSNGTTALTSKTDDQGAFAFFHVPQGEYSVTADLPDGLQLGEYILNESPLTAMGTWEIGPTQCRLASLYVMPSGQIRGRVLDSNGNPTPEGTVQIYPAEMYGKVSTLEYEYQDKGSYHFDHLSPGDYLVVFNDRVPPDPSTPYNLTFYPGVTDRERAVPIHIEPGQKVLNADIRLGDARPIRQTKVRISWKDGRAAKQHGIDTLPGIYAEGTSGEGIEENDLPDGTYSIKFLADVDYNIHATVVCRAWRGTANGPVGTLQSQTVRLPASEPLPPEINLVLNGNSCPK